MTTVRDSSRPASLRSGLYVLTPDGPLRAGLVRPDDQLLLCVELHAGDWPHELVVELWRGDRLRDRRRQRCEAGGVVTLTLQLHHSGAVGSSRLTCRVLLDDQPAASHTALLGREEADAQGRFADSAVVRSASARTLLAFSNELQRQLGDVEGDPV